MSDKPWTITGLAETKIEYDLSGGLVTHHCQHTSVKLANVRLFIDVSPKTKTFYRGGPLLDLMQEFRESCKGPEQLHEFLKGFRVQLGHLKNKNGHLRTKTIAELASLPTLGANAEQVSFFWKEKRAKVTVTKYYREGKYGLRNESPIKLSY